jgi:maltose alpha-D-glucosyltransferase/alpha-amylase
MGADHITRWCTALQSEAEGVLARLQAMTDLSEPVAHYVRELMAKRHTLFSAIDDLSRLHATGLATRIHGDYHLGQVLIAKDDVVIIDFEGEPARTLAERREKTSPLRDVAGMLRSLDYAASAALDRFFNRSGSLPDRVVAATAAWRNRAGREFMTAYIETAAEMPSLPQDRNAATALLDLFLLQKTLYEISYETANRPAWLGVPLRGLLDLLERTEATPR